MKKLLTIFITIFVFCGCTIILYFVNKHINKPEDIAVSRISIGGGGAFFNPMFDPTDEDVYYVTSDMGALYYSHNKGETWNRSEARSVFTQTHISKNGTVFAGGNGIYSSIDKGKTLNLIYPKDVKVSVSRCGWNENLMLAEGYDNGYLKCITSNDNYIFFVTIDWEGNLRLSTCDYNGEKLSILAKIETSVVDPMSDMDVFMLCEKDGLYVTLGEAIYYYDFNNTASWTSVTSFHTSYAKMSFALFNNMLYLFGGYIDGGYDTEINVFVPIGGE